MERQLEIGEEFFILYHKHGVGQICYVYFINSEISIAKTKLEDAMCVLVNRHPLLRASVYIENGCFYWRINETVTMDIRTEERRDWQMSFSEALSGGFDIENGPLWRVTLLPSVDSSEFFDESFDHHAALLFRFSHAIIDGLGRTVIHIILRINTFYLGYEC